MFCFYYRYNGALIEVDDVRDFIFIAKDMCIYGNIN